MPSIRQHKIADQIRDELAVLIRDDVDEARTALVTVTSVSVTSDYRLARVFVSIFPESVDREAVLTALRRGRGRLKRDLGRNLALRHVPDLDFRLDTSAEQGERIERLLRGDPPSGGDGPGGGEAGS